MWSRLSSRSPQVSVDELARAGVDGLLVSVSREDVESHDISWTLDILSGLLADAATVENFQGRVNVSFAGFDDDPREIYEIPEIRRFCSELDKKFPYWLYFLSTDDSSLKMMVFCLCKIEKKGPGLVMLDNIDLGRFLYTHFPPFNELFAKYSLNEHTNRTISDKIFQYLEVG